MNLATPLEVAREEGRLAGYQAGFKEGSIGKLVVYAECQRLLAILTDLCFSAVDMDGKKAPTLSTLSFERE